MSARNLFDEMPASDWRSPSRVLEIIIHQVSYPVTEDVLLQVFSQIGEVDEVCMYKGLDHVEARVVFQSKHEAAEAYGDLHGRNIYDGCCQMEIKWGVSQDPNVSAAMSNGNTTSLLLPSATADMSTIDELGLEKLLVEADASSELAEVTDCEETIASIIAKEAIIDTGVVAAAALAIDIAVSNVTIDTPTACATECLATDILVHSNLGDPVFEEEMLSGSNTLFNRGIGLEMLVKPSCKDLLYGCNINNYELLGGSVPLDMHGKSALVLWPTLMNWLERQPWPPPAGLEPASGDADPRPLPWPSFHLTEGFNVGWSFSFLGKPPWPPPACQGFRCEKATMVDGHKYMLMTSGRHMIILNSKEYQPWDPGIMVRSFTRLLLMYNWDMFLLKANSSCVLNDLHEILNILELLVRNELIKAQFRCCSTVCAEFSMADSNNQNASKWSVVHRELMWLLTWTYGPWTGLSTSVGVPLPQTFIYLQLKLVCRMGCLLAKTDCEHSLLRLSHLELSVQAALINMLANGSTSYCYSHRELHQQMHKNRGAAEHIFSRSIIAFNGSLVICYKIQISEHNGGLVSCMKLEINLTHLRFGS